MSAFANADSAFVVALTGGIATGKSTACERFTRYGIPIFDADVASRQAVEPGSPALEEIAAAFGAGVLDASGALDRARMRALVFSDAAARRRLESIVHPRVRQILSDQAHACQSAYCVLAIPLLVEARADYAWVDRVLVMDAPVEVQFARLLTRPGIDAALARCMLEAQASRDTRLALADDVIDSEAPIAWLDAAIERLHRHYLALAESRRSIRRPEG